MERRTSRDRRTSYTISGMVDDAGDNEATAAQVLALGNGWKEMESIAPGWLWPLPWRAAWGSPLSTDLGRAADGGDSGQLYCSETEKLLLLWLVLMLTSIITAQLFTTLPLLKPFCGQQPEPCCPIVTCRDIAIQNIIVTTGTIEKISQAHTNIQETSLD